MSRQEILDILTRMFSTMTEAEDITEACELVDDLGISSMDLLTLMSYIEEEFRIQVSERSIRNIVTVADVVDVVLAGIHDSAEKPSAKHNSPFPFRKSKSVLSKKTEK